MRDRNPPEEHEGVFKAYPEVRRGKAGPVPRPLEGKAAAALTPGASGEVRERERASRLCARKAAKVGPVPVRVGGEALHRVDVKLLRRKQGTPLTYLRKLLRRHGGIFQHSQEGFLFSRELISGSIQGSTGI